MDQGPGSKNRAKRARESRVRKEDPRKGRGSRSARVPDEGSRGSSSGDEPLHGNASLPSTLRAAGYEIVEGGPAVREAIQGTHIPADHPRLPPEDAELSEYKGVSLRDVGRDKHGKIIPHRRDEKLARKITVWVAGGYDVNAIAVHLNIRPGLLKQHYGRELAIGADIVGMDVTRHIVSRVKKSDRMAIFYAKAKMGWRDGEGGPTDTGLLNIHIHA